MNPTVLPALLLWEHQVPSKVCILVLVARGVFEITRPQFSLLLTGTQDTGPPSFPHMHMGRRLETTQVPGTCGSHSMGPHPCHTPEGTRGG